MVASNYSCDPRRLPDRKQASHTRIVYDEPTSGCCNTGCILPCVKGRSYNRINEDSFETNRSLLGCCCCCKTYDCVRKTYIDQEPFVCSYTDPQFTSYKDSCYCCYCINCALPYDLCGNAFCGEVIFITPCYSSGCFADQPVAKIACIRCCSCPWMFGLLNSSTFAHRLQKQIEIQNKKGTGSYDEDQSPQLTPPRSELLHRPSPSPAAPNSTRSNADLALSYDTGYIPTYRYD